MPSTFEEQFNYADLYMTAPAGFAHVRTCRHMPALVNSETAASRHYSSKYPVHALCAKRFHSLSHALLSTTACCVCI